jgi:hypothetical protein
MGDELRSGKKPRVEPLRIRKETVQPLSEQEAGAAAGGRQGLGSDFCTGKLACAGKNAKGFRVN